MITTLAKALIKTGLVGKGKPKKKAGMGTKAMLKAADFKKGQKFTKRKTTMADLAPTLKQYVEEKS
jgi:hypothetical protein